MKSSGRWIKMAEESARRWYAWSTVTPAKWTAGNYCLQSQVQVILQWKINQSLTFRAKYQCPWQGQPLYQPELQSQQLDPELSRSEDASSAACGSPVNVLLHLTVNTSSYPVVFLSLLYYSYHCSSQHLHGSYWFASLKSLQLQIKNSELNWKFQRKN